MENLQDVNVAPRKRRVSRNARDIARAICGKVAPRKRRVSRNLPVQSSGIRGRVAPRKRRVSRNFACGHSCQFLSYSARADK